MNEFTSKTAVGNQATVRGYQVLEALQYLRTAKKVLGSDSTAGDQYVPPVNPETYKNANDAVAQAPDSAVDWARTELGKSNDTDSTWKLEYLNSARPPQAYIQVNLSDEARIEKCWLQSIDLPDGRTVAMFRKPKGETVPDMCDLFARQVVQLHEAKYGVVPTTTFDFSTLNPNDNLDKNKEYEIQVFCWPPDILPEEKNVAPTTVGTLAGLAYRVHNDFPDDKNLIGTALDPGDFGQGEAVGTLKDGGRMTGVMKESALRSTDSGPEISLDDLSGKSPARMLTCVIREVKS